MENSLVLADTLRYLQSATPTIESSQHRQRHSSSHQHDDIHDLSHRGARASTSMASYDKTSKFQGVQKKEVDVGSRKAQNTHQPGDNLENLRAFHRRQSVNMRVSSKLRNPSLAFLPPIDSNAQQREEGNKKSPLRRSSRKDNSSSGIFSTPARLLLDADASISDKKLSSTQLGGLKKQQPSPSALAPAHHRKSTNKHVQLTTLGGKSTITTQTPTPQVTQLSMSSWVNGVSPNIVSTDTLECTTILNHELGEFDRDVQEKIAFERFLHDKEQTVPTMVMKQFRHQICDNSPLVQLLRVAPLSRIESAICDVFTSAHKVLQYSSFCALLQKMLGPGVTYSRVDSQSLFSFLDSDADDDVDLREVCSGLVLVLSGDGSRVSVLHRCHSMLHPHNIKDTRLTFMKRFELVMMAKAILDVAVGVDKNQLEYELHRMLGNFGCDKRGQFPLDAVRSFVLANPLIRQAIDSFTVPREQELFRSFISQFFRNSDAEEGEQSFKLMRTMQAREERAQRTNGDHAKRPDKKDLERLEKINMDLEEPHNPKYYTLKGVLYRQFDDYEAQPFWMEGMPVNVKYSGLSTGDKSGIAVNPVAPMGASKALAGEKQTEAPAKKQKAQRATSPNSDDDD